MINMFEIDEQSCTDGPTIISESFAFKDTTIFVSVIIHILCLDLEDDLIFIDTYKN